MTARVSRWLDGAETGLNYLSAVILFGLMFYVTAEVVMRYLFNRPLSGHFEASELLVVPAAFLPIAYVQARRGHVGVDLLILRLDSRTRTIVDCVTLAVALATFAIIAWMSGENTWLALTMGDVTPTSQLSTWWSKAAVPVGSALLCARLATQLGKNVSALRRG